MSPDSRKKCHDLSATTNTNEYMYYSLLYFFEKNMSLEKTSVKAVICVGNLKQTLVKQNMFQKKEISSVQYEIN